MIRFYVKINFCYVNINDNRFIWILFREENYNNVMKKDINIFMLLY